MTDPLPRLLFAFLVLFIFSLTPSFLSAQTTPAPSPSQTQTTTSPDRRAGIDLSVAFTRNIPRNSIEGTAGLRFQRSFYAPRIWRFVFSFRPSLQINLSPLLNLYNYASLEVGARFLIFSFLSMEYYVGPRFTVQTGRSGFAALTGPGGTGAWLIHPWRDNRQRLRLGIEYFQLQVLGDDDTLGLFGTRHLGGFLGFESNF